MWLEVIVVLAYILIGSLLAGVTLDEGEEDAAFGFVFLWPVVVAAMLCYSPVLLVKLIWSFKNR